MGIFFLQYFSNAKPPIKNIIINTIKSPIIIAVFAGGIASALSVSFPAPIENFLSLVSKSASPIALFAVGMFMAGKRISSAKGKIFTLCLLNLLALPIITYGIGWIFGLTGVPLKVSFLEAAMPLAVTNFVIAQKYKLYEDVVASAIVISTIVSIITIGAGMLFIQS
ncbi:AEC family transporter [Candidatus Uhrbacteria bacterium]|nr:AEC family transporter [Candidatus Uhrbacteria bacterium]